MRARRTVSLVGLGVLGLTVVSRLRPFRVVVDGESMLPGLRPGDQLVAVRPRRIRRGDLVVVRPRSRDLEMVKRVAGVPGDVLRDGLVLGPDEYLVLGDNASRSTDSRAFGPVLRGDITGVVRFRYLPRPGPVS